MTSVLIGKTGFERILDGNGFAITLTGMLLVFFSLLMISLAIALLPRVLSALKNYLPDLDAHEAGSSKKDIAAARADGAASGEVSDQLIAAIGLALHARRSD